MSDDIASVLEDLDNNLTEADLMSCAEVAKLTGYRRETVWRWASRISEGKAIVLPGAIFPITRAYRTEDGNIRYNRREIELIVKTREESFRKNSATVAPTMALLGQLGEDGSR